jgi:hypothetical protein
VISQRQKIGKKITAKTPRPQGVKKYIVWFDVVTKKISGRKMWNITEIIDARPINHFFSPSWRLGVLVVNSFSILSKIRVL